MAQEIELKLAFPPEALAQVLAHPLLAGAERQGTSKTLINTYFDTPGLSLSAHRIAVRTRKAGELWLQTVKCAADSFGGLSSRPEWEQAYSGRFDFSAVDAEAVRAVLEAEKEALVPLFTTDFMRDTLAITPREGVRILIMIDRGEISAGGRQESISELELELVSGEADDLLAIACVLTASLPLLPYDPSKAARGYRLFHDAPILPQTSELPKIRKSETAREAFRQRALACLAAWSANHHAALTDDAPEFIHQLRVALNRLRQLIRIFAPVLPEAIIEHGKGALRASAASLGELREYQELRDEIILPAGEDDLDAYLPPLLARAEEACRKHLLAVRESLAKPGAGLAQLEFARALMSMSSEDATPAQEVVRHAIHTLQVQAEEQLDRAASDFRNESLHALRLTIKQLRLACELAPDARKEARRRLIRSLAALQSRLGKLNDLAQAVPVLGRWAAEQVSLAMPVAFLIGWQTATSLKLRRTILRRAGRVVADASAQRSPKPRAGKKSPKS